MQKNRIVHNISRAVMLLVSLFIFFETAYPKGIKNHLHKNRTFPPFSGGTITNNPLVQNIYYGNIPAQLTTTTASGGTCGGVYTYLWEFSTDNITFDYINGATAQNYQPDTLFVTTYFRRKTICNGQIAYTNNVATINVSIPPLIPGTITPHSYDLNYNDFCPTLTLNGTSGGDFTYTYQWQKSTDGTTFTEILDAVSPSYPPFRSLHLTVTTYFRVAVTSHGNTAYSDTATVNVYPDLIPGTISPATQFISYNSNATQLSLTGVGGGNGTYSYQWQSSNDNYRWTNIGSISGTTYTPTSLMDTIYYRVVVGSNNRYKYSAVAVVYVAPPPLLNPGLITPLAYIVQSGASPGILSANPASGGSCSGSYSYQWQKSTDGINFTDIVGQTGLTFNPGNLTATQYYRRKVTCGLHISYTNVCTITVGTISTNTLNYIRVRDVMKSGIVDTASANTLNNLRDVKQTTQYFDGLGRLFQTVNWQASPLKKDIVTPITYDEQGRQQINYLSFPSTTNTGDFNVNPLSEQYAFNGTQFSDEQFFYSQTNYEVSPLSRVVSSTAQGSSWTGSNRGISYQYLINTASDSVRVWRISSLSGSLPVTTTTYSAGQLYKTVTIDEHNNEVVEYKDKEGQIILKKVQLQNNPAIGHSGWLCTYYVYDTLRQLRFVIQPQAVEAIKSSWTITQSIADELCFRYEYDSRRRMILKKIPGSGIVYMIYDANNRLVMTQDSAIRAAHKWLYTLYDGLNRPTTTGLIIDNTNYNNVAYHRSHADTSTAWPNVTNYTDEQLTKTFYDDYSWRAGEGNPLNATRSTTYDNYLLTSYSTWPYSQPVAQTSLLRGLITGTKTKIIGTNTYLYNVNFYDEHARLIQVQSTNITGDSTIVTTQYSFSGQPLITIEREGKAGANAQVSVVLTQITYDDFGRIVKTEKKVSNTKVNGGTMASSWKTVSQNEYDELSQLKKKKLGTAPVDSLVYDYNIRGWMLGANRDFAKSTSSTANLFGFDLGYDKTTIQPTGASSIGSYTASQYNGNITGMLWKSTGDDQIRKYDFTYDAVNRLTGADFNQYTSSAFNKTAGIDFSVSNLSYDANGNILTQNQKGWKVGGSSFIDQLSYSYTASSNKLLQVTDASNDNTSKLGDFKYDAATKTTTDYSYDGNGNLTLDNNKKISSIVYNYLNLPQTITVTGKGTISYVYDAAGNKLQKITVDNTVSPAKTTTTLYLFGTYENDLLQFLPMEEGRIRPVRDANNNITSFTYDYFLKDHLGNVRMVLTEEAKTDMYPAATMEAATITSESAYYGNLTTTQYAKPSWFSDPLYTSSTQVARVKNNSTTQKLGPNILLKVMAGDSYNIRVASGWSSGSTPVNSSSEVLNDLILALSGGLSAVSGGKATQIQLQDPSSGLSTGISNFLSNQTSSGAPKAYINWVLFDEQFKYYDGGFEQVGASGVTTIHTRNGLSILKNGYLYVYTSNEATNIDVFFDNLQVTHIRGPILEETHYYPFGLTTSGISSRALSFGGVINKRKFNYGSELQSEEFSDGSGLEMYDTKFRGLDPQLGRWWQRDPLAEFHYGISPYAYVLNNPLSYNDPLGLDTVRVNGEGRHKIKVRQGDVLAWTIGETTSYYTYDPKNKDAVNGFVGAGIQNDTPLPEVTVTAKAKPKDDNSQPLAWAPLAGLVNNSVNTAGGFIENFANARTTLGYGFKQPWYKLKLYPSGFPGNQYVSTFNVAKAGKLAGKITFGVGTAIDAYGVYTYYTEGAESPNAVSPAKAGVNLGVGVYGLYGGPPGWIIGGIYFGIDATIGWPAAIQSSIEMEKNKATLRQANIINYSDFKN